MKIKKLGFMSFKLDFDSVSIVTDPFSVEEAGLKFPATEGDVVVFSEDKYCGQHNIIAEKGFTKITPKNRETLFEIQCPGEYEVGGVLIRRALNSGIYIFDEGYLRVVYMGMLSSSFKGKELADLGDVDVLIVPVGNSDLFPDYDVVEKLVSKIDPTYLIPAALFEDGMKAPFDKLKTKEDFKKLSGYGNVSEDKTVNITGSIEKDEKRMEVVILE